MKIIAIDREPKASIGGIRAGVDYTVQEYRDFASLAMLILPGGFFWQENRY